VSAPAQPGDVKAARVLLLVFGGLLTLVALGLLIAGGILGWAQAFERDSDGYFATNTERLQTPTYALTSERIDLGAEPGDASWPFGAGALGTVRLRAAAAGGTPVFIGIAHQADVDRYLAGVAHDEIANADFSGADLGRVDVRYQRVAGTAQPQPPGDQTFWDTKATGAGTQTVTWDIRSGKWAAVVMNASGAAAVTVDASVGAKADWVLPVAIGLLIGGAMLLTGGILMVVKGAHGLGQARPAGAAPDGAALVPVAPVVGAVPASSAEAVHARSYPLRLDGRLDPDLSRGLWVVKWFLAIPHFVVLFFLWVAFAILTAVAFFGILFTGRYPRSIFDFNVGVLRWTWRVSFYSYSALGTDRYPPFTLEDVADYPARLAVDYPEQLSRGLVLVKWWLLAIPQYIIVGLFGGGLWGTAGWWGDHRGGDWFGGWSARGGGLIGILVLIAGVVLLFTRRYPAEIFRFLMGLNRWLYRVIAYSTLMRDEYPPFRLDAGGTDPGTAARAAAPAVEVEPEA
jgi:hypothetical protein